LQNAARIIRALLEIALSRNWANNAILLIDLSKAIEHRMWPYEHPLAQITTLHRDTLFNLRQYADNTEIAQLREMEPQVLGDLVHMNEKHGLAIREAALQFPTISVEYALRPLSHDLLQISVCVKPQFTWSAKVSSSGEPFYVWIQDEEGINILQWRSILIRQTTTKVDIDFLIPLTDTPPPSYTILSASDRWLGSDDSRLVPLDMLVMPRSTIDITPLLDIPYLHISALDDPHLEGMYKPFIQTMNGIQSQAFWSAYHTQANMLVSAPVSSGKSFLGEVAIW
jgi:antiviral helicase SLH1